MLWWYRPAWYYNIIINALHANLIWLFMLMNFTLLFTLLFSILFWIMCFYVLYYCLLSAFGSIMLIPNWNGSWNEWNLLSMESSRFLLFNHRYLILMEKWVYTSPRRILGLIRHIHFTILFLIFLQWNILRILWIYLIICLVHNHGTILVIFTDTLYLRWDLLHSF